MIQEIRFVKDYIRGLCFGFFIRGPHKHLRIDKTAFLSGLENITIGNNVFLNRGCIIQGGGGVSIGDNTLIGPYVQIYSEEHNKADYKIAVGESIYIGPNCWIGANVIILKGSFISRDTIVPAGAIVTRKGGIICQGYLSAGVRDSLASILAKNS